MHLDLFRTVATDNRQFSPSFGSNWANDSQPWPNPLLGYPVIPVSKGAGGPTHTLDLALNFTTSAISTLAYA